MKCNEVKNLLFEANDLTEIMADDQLQTHITECSQCRAAFKYEQKLREGFTSISQQQPPADIGAKILAMSAPEQASATGWWQSVIDTLAQISLKTAAVSCLAGFILAMLVFRQSEPVVPQQDIASVTEDAIREIATEVETPSAPEPKVAKIKTQAEADMIIASKEDTEAIPGAKSSFSIHDESESLISSRSNEQQAFAIARSRAAAPSMAPGESFDSDKSATILFSKIAETNTETTVKERADPRAAELEKLLKESGIELQPGQLDLSQLAMRGLISSEKLISLRSPAGSHWFVEEQNGAAKIILKNNR